MFCRCESGISNIAFLIIKIFSLFESLNGMIYATCLIIMFVHDHGLCFSGVNDSSIRCIRFHKITTLHVSNYVNEYETKEDESEIGLTNLNQRYV